MRLPPSRAYERNETSKPLAGIDGIKHEGFQGTPQFDRLDRCDMRDTISRSSVTGDDLHVRLIERHLKQLGSGAGVSNNVGSYPLWFGIDVDPDHARAFERNRCADHETGLCRSTARSVHDRRWVEAASRRLGGDLIYGRGVTNGP